MSKANGESLNLTGVGSAYIRVSTDQQDTERQYAACRAFEQRNDVSIAEHLWFKDEGWARDEADRRPDFQRLLTFAESGRIDWVVVDALDRFGTKDAHQLLHYIYRLRECGCKLYGAAGKEWTGEDIATIIITAVVEGEKSKGEQTSKSHRVLGGKAEKARLGEWQGGPVRLGFDVACYHRETDKELWRVIFEGRNKRLKVYPDGRSERFDGPDNFPKCQPLTEVLRTAPSQDEGKVAAAVSIFKRYATESISFTALARYLNDLGWRNGCGGFFQGQQIEEMLGDPIYLGYYTWNKWHFGKFHRYSNNQTLPELNYAEKGSKNDRSDWVQSYRLFDPLVDLNTWNAVKDKLANRSKRSKAPKSAAQYLAGMVYCGNCGCRMVAGQIRNAKANPRKDGHTGERYEFYCGSYFKAVRDGRRHECKCLRNGVFQDTLEIYVERYLEETGRRLDLMTQDLDTENLTAELDRQEWDAWQALQDGLGRVIEYLAENHLDEYVWAMQGDTAGHPLREPENNVETVLKLYRNLFDPSAVEAELKDLEAKHTAKMVGWADLPTPRAKEKAKKELAALESRIEELEKQQENVAEVVEQSYRQLKDLRLAVEKARLAMKSESSERALRQRAEALRAIIQRIECTFTATGETGGGWGKKNAQLVKVKIYPVVGDSLEFSADSKGTVKYSSAHSFMNRTRCGRMR